MAKLNCWEFTKCGREPGGVNAEAQGVCPAASESALDGLHGGRNSGRTCWVLAGTLCKGEVQGTFAKKFVNCEACDFYKTVKQEENSRFQLSMVLLSKLKSA